MQTPIKKKTKKHKLSSCSDNFKLNDNSTLAFSFSTEDNRLTKRANTFASIPNPDLTKSPFNNFQFDEYGQLKNSDLYNQGLGQHPSRVLLRRRINSYNEAPTNNLFEDPINKTDDYLVKYKTEICKNFEFRGYCKWDSTVG